MPLCPDQNVRHGHEELLHGCHGYGTLLAATEGCVVRSLDVLHEGFRLLVRHCFSLRAKLGAFWMMNQRASPSVANPSRAIMNCQQVRVKSPSSLRLFSMCRHMSMYGQYAHLVNGKTRSPPSSSCILASRSFISAWACSQPASPWKNLRLRHQRPHGLLVVRALPVLGPFSLPPELLDGGGPLAPPPASERLAGGAPCAAVGPCCKTKAHSPPPPLGGGGGRSLPIANAHLVPVLLTWRVAKAQLAWAPSLPVRTSCSGTCQG